MKIELNRITIRVLSEGYKNSNEEGVVAYNGKLDVRPKYQREFVYKDEQRDAVINTIRRNFPLNIMYWVKKDNGTYEILDGQQRTISICSYINGEYSINNKYFHTLQKDEQEQILNYELMIYFCEGKDSEKLDWFKTVNIAGEKLTEQELRNAVYAGEWLTKAKRDFSKSGCRAMKIGDRYMKGSAIRQDILETVLNWISEGKIESYMANHQHDTNDHELWMYFCSVIDWVKNVFPKYRKEMKGLPWGQYYNRHKDTTLTWDSTKTEVKIAKLMEDDDVQKKSGIYQYIMTGDEKYLNIRIFDKRTKRTVYERQNGICKVCKKYFEFEEMEADHITPWHEGGKTVIDNCQMLCKECNRRKSGK